MVDCQTPGWLSSKINYVDQQTVRNLKVTGYINATDLDFIGSLTQMSLNGIVDLGDATIIGNSWNGCFKLNVIDKYYAEYEYNLQKLILPKTLLEYKESHYVGYTNVDTLVYDIKGSNIDKLNFERSINYLLIGESVDTVKDRISVNHINAISFPKALRYIGDEAFYDVLFNASETNLHEFPSLEYMGNYAFVNYPSSPSNKATLPDTIKLPSIKEFYITAFDYKEKMHIYLGEGLETLTYKSDIRVGKIYWQPSLQNVFFHLKTSTPPRISVTSGYNGVMYYPTGLTLCIPKGSKEAYEKVMSIFPFYTLIEEDVAIEAIILDCHELSLEVNDEMQLSTRVVPENADVPSILWTSEDESIAMVNGEGVVKAVSSGRTNIIAQSSDGLYSDTCQVTIIAHANEITLSTTVLCLENIGDVAILNAMVSPENAINKDVTWLSSNDLVCAVSDTGLVTATGVGTAIITVTTVDGGLTATCIVRVVQHVEDIVLNKAQTSLKVGESEKLIATISPTSADNKDIIWSSSDEQIASVDEGGLVTALKVGNVVITATSVDSPGLKATCTISVVQPVTGITVAPLTCTLQGIGSEVQLTAEVQPDDAANKNVKWSSSNESVCIVA